jgi:hypothetical protein
VLALCLGSVALAAEGFDPAAMIGMSPRDVFAARGAPQEVFTARGAADGEEDAVFFYPDCTYLFWHGNRVWQVRCDRRYAGTVFGLSLGMTRDRVTERLGESLSERGSSLYFDVSGAAYPTRVRLVFSAERLSDVYVYRSDF